MKPTKRSYEDLVLDLLAEPGTSKDALGSLILRFSKDGDSLPSKEEARRMERNLRKRIRRDERRHQELERKAAMRKREALPDPEDQSAKAIASETRSALHRAILDLGTTLQAIVRAHYFEEKSVREIAAERGVAPGTVSCQLFRARERIRESMTRTFGIAWVLPLTQRTGIECTPQPYT